MVGGAVNGSGVGFTKGYEQVVGGAVGAREPLGTMMRKGCKIINI